MFPHHHYLVTTRVLGERDALIAFLVDFEPARSVVHNLFDSGAQGLRRLALIVPKEYWPGVLAHIVEDAYWSGTVRRFYMDRAGGSIWVHRLHETFWARRRLGAITVNPPRGLIEDFLSVFGPYDHAVYEEMLARLEWLLHGPEDEVLEWYRARLGPQATPRPEIIDEHYDEDKLILLLDRVLKPWRHTRA